VRDDKYRISNIFNNNRFGILLCSIIGDVVMIYMMLIALIAGIVITIVFRNYPDFHSKKTIEEFYKERTWEQ